MTDLKTSDSTNYSDNTNSERSRSCHETSFTSSVTPSFASSSIISDTVATKVSPSDTKSNPLLTALRHIFGFDSFRPNQEEIIKAIFQKRDVLAVMPTGGGKSLCYQYPAVVLKGTCVVVSPLISLMKDQVDAAKEIGLCAASLNSGSTKVDYIDISRLLESGELDLLYVSPERFNSENFVPWLKQGQVSFFAIDEAHCISQWGHHFRPDYMALSQMAKEFPETPIAAFTATATDFVSQDIITQIGLRNPYCVRASFDRPNLYYQIQFKENLSKQLVDFLKGVPDQSGIIYRGTRKNTEETASMLVQKGFNAKAYHAGMSTEERAAIQEAFLNDEIRIIVATIAFGMGIDKSNVRFVVHGDLPKNIEGYYQETGRAGRDGSPAHCLLLYGYQDIQLQYVFLSDMPEGTVRDASRRQLETMIQFAESDQCRRKGLLAYFGETYSHESCDNCDYCNHKIVRNNVTIECQKLLSAVVRTGNRFGITHIIDIVMGADTDKIRRYQHDQLKTWGVGKDRPKSFWRRIVNLLVSKGKLEYDSKSEFPILRITEEGKKVLFGKDTVELIQTPSSKTSKRASKPSFFSDNRSGNNIRSGSNSSNHSNNNENELENENDRSSIKYQDGDKSGSIVSNQASIWENSKKDSLLFARLKALRKELAQQKKVPPYVIFTDKSLLEMVHFKPTNREEMLKICGVGENKMKTYGELFLAVIQDVSCEDELL